MKQKKIIHSARITNILLDVYTYEIKLLYVYSLCLFMILLYIHYFSRKCDIKNFIKKKYKYKKSMTIIGKSDIKIGNAQLLFTLKYEFVLLVVFSSACVCLRAFSDSPCRIFLLFSPPVIFENLPQMRHGGSSFQLFFVLLS